MVRRIALGTNLAYSSQILHVRGQRHGAFTTNGSGRKKSNPLTAGGLLKILRDLYSRPYPMVQGIEDHVLANSSCGGQVHRSWGFARNSEGLVLPHLPDWHSQDNITSNTKSSSQVKYT